jgi:hypothetical protein
MRLSGQLFRGQRLWQRAMLQSPVSDGVVLAVAGAGEICRLAGFVVARPGRAAWPSCEPVGHGGSVRNSAGAGTMGVTADLGQIAGG